MPDPTHAHCQSCRDAHRVITTPDSGTYEVVRPWTPEDGTRGEACRECGPAPVWVGCVPFRDFATAFAAYLELGRDLAIYRAWDEGDGEWLDGLSAAERATVLAADRGAA